MSTCRRNDAVTEDGILKVVTTENQLHQKTTLVPQADDQRGKRLLVSELPPNTVPPHNANIVDKLASKNIELLFLSTLQCY